MREIRTKAGSVVLRERVFHVKHIVVPAGQSMLTAHVLERMRYRDTMLGPQAGFAGYESITLPVMEVWHG